MSASVGRFPFAQPSTVKEAVAACVKHPGSRYDRGRHRPHRQHATRHRQPGFAGRSFRHRRTERDQKRRPRRDHRRRRDHRSACPRHVRSPSQYRALAQAAAAIAGPGHRVMATVGGNLCLDTRCIYYNQSEWWRSANAYCLKNRGDICHVAPQGQRCHAAFSGDLAPALLVYGAEVDIAGPQGQRRIALSDLYVEDGKAHLALAKGELVVAVHLPAPPPPSAYEKVRVRGAIDFPLGGRSGCAHVVWCKHRFAAHRADRHELPAVPARRHRSLCRPAGRRATCCKKSIGWCRSRCSRCAPRLRRRIIAASPPPRWRGV